MREVYFYERAGQQAGPLAADQLVAHGVEASTLVWRAGMLEWVAAGTIPELRAVFAPAIPAQMPPPPTAKASPVKPLRPAAPTLAPVRSVFTGRSIKIGIVALLALGAELASRVKPDEAEEPEKTAQQVARPVFEEEIKEIGYADRHLHEEEADTNSETSARANPAVSELVQEDAIEDIDNNGGWLTVHYAVGAPRSFGVGKDPFFAYSPHVIVTHDARVGCQVRDIYGNRLTTGFTHNGSAACTGLRVIGDQIVIDVDTGHSTHQEIYDANLHLLRTSQSHMY